MAENTSEKTNTEIGGGAQGNTQDPATQDSNTIDQGSKGGQAESQYSEADLDNYEGYGYDSLDQ